jgi:phosphoribosylaminoimidazole-succinocarboxamide synthase
VLNQLSVFWFEKTARIVPNHLVEAINDVSQLDAYRPAENSHPSFLAGRSMVVRRAERIPVECVVRGYLSGSAWAEYRQSGTIHNLPAPAGLKESQQLSPPVFTPTTKADSGHDEPLSMGSVAQLVGKSLAEELKEKSLAIYSFAEEYARSRGIIIADTKFEFGLLGNQVILIDELLTPDSSRFWDTSDYRVGQPQPAFDKQMVRDWLTSSGWNKEPPAPTLPDDLIQRTAERYREVYRRLTGVTIQH